LGKDRWSLLTAHLGGNDYYDDAHRTVLPADRLKLAILQDALLLLRYRKPTRARADAARWVLSAEEDHQFSYVAICERLEIDPASLRRSLVGILGPLEALQAWRVQPRSQKASRRRRE